MPNSGGVGGGGGGGASSSRTTGGTPRRSHTNQRDLPIFLGRSDPRRFLKHYKLACSANGEDTEDDYVRLLPLSLVGAASEWYLDLTDAERADWGNINTLFLKWFGSERLAR